MFLTNKQTDFCYYLNEVIGHSFSVLNCAEEKQNGKAKVVAIYWTLGIPSSTPLVSVDIPRRGGYMQLV